MKLFFFFLTLCFVLNSFAAEVDPAEQKMMEDLKTRRTLLNWHQYTAWATGGLMLGALVNPPGDDDEKVSSTHKWFGIGAGAMYLTSASLAYFAPKPEGTNQQDNIMIHKKLIWLHAPAMALTVAAGLSANNDRKNHRDQSSFSKLHKVAVPIALVSFAAAGFMSTEWGMSILPTSKKDLACVLTKTF